MAEITPGHRKSCQHAVQAPSYVGCGEGGLPTSHIIQHPGDRIIAAWSILVPQLFPDRREAMTGRCTLAL